MENDLVERLRDPIEHMGVPYGAISLMGEAAERIQDLELELEDLKLEMKEEKL